MQEKQLKLINTDQVTGAWSKTGGAGDPQPDNREFKVRRCNTNLKWEDATQNQYGRESPVVIKIEITWSQGKWPEYLSPPIFCHGRLKTVSSSNLSVETFSSLRLILSVPVETFPLSGGGEAWWGVHCHVEQLLCWRRGQLPWHHPIIIIIIIVIVIIIAVIMIVIYVMSKIKLLLKWADWQVSPGVARHCLLPQEVVRLRGLRQADGLCQADQPGARPQNLEQALPYLSAYLFSCQLHQVKLQGIFFRSFGSFPINSILWKYW